MKTKFVNGTNSVITLKEGNSGMQRFLFKLEKKDDPKSSCNLTLDTNATYREYHLYSICTGTRATSAAEIVVSSDHLVDNKEITIMETATPGVFTWEGIPRYQKHPCSENRKTDPVRSSSKSSLPGVLTLSSSRTDTPTCVIL